MSDTSHRHNTGLIKSENTPESVMSRLGMAVKRVGQQLHAACPGCGKTDKFDVHADSGAFNCFSCSIGGGDVISLVMETRGVTFTDACEWLGGDRPLSAKEQREQDAKQAKVEAAARAAAARKARADKAEIAGILKQLKPGAGSPVQDYLIGRGLRAGLRHLGWLNDGGWPRDVSFHPALPAFAGPKGARQPVGHHPAMVSLGRNADGDIVLVHRTFLAVRPDGTVTKAGPTTSPKLAHVDPRQWKAKQMTGPLSACDRGVSLGVVGDITHDPMAVSIVGEGIETVLAAASVGVSGEYFAGLSLNRLVGTQQPNPHGNTGFAFAPNGRARIILADHDFSPTLAFADDPDRDPGPLGEDHLGGARRARHEFGRAQRRLQRGGDTVAVAWPPLGTDFNDALCAA